MFTDGFTVRGRVLLYSDGTHYFGAYRGAAKQGQPTGMRPCGDLVLQHLTGSHKCHLVFKRTLLGCGYSVLWEACVHTHTHTQIVRIYILWSRWCRQAKT